MNRQAITLGLIVLLVLFIGCIKIPSYLPVQAPESIKQEADLNFGGITDPVELEKLWQEYLYDSITTVGNTRNFNSAQEIAPLNVAMFAWSKYVTEYGKESLELADKHSTLRLFPLDKVLEYAERYFNLDSLDVSNIEVDAYDAQQRAFLFDFGSDRPHPAYNAVNSWGVLLDRVTRNSDGTVTATLIRYGSPKTDRIELTMTYTLKQREDGSLYFDSGRWDYMNNHLVSLSGDYQRYDKIAGFDGNLAELSMIGEDDGKLILADLPYEKSKNPALLLVNPETMKVEKRFDFQDNLELPDIRLIADKIMVRLKDKIITVDKALGGTKDTTPLPQVIKAKIERKPKYDKNGLPDIFFGSYDVSGDLKKIVYADEIGVKLFNLIDNSEKLLAPTVSIKGSKFLDNSYHKQPRFVDHGQKVITTMTDYEGTRGYTLCDLIDFTVQTIENSTDSHPGTIWYDSGLLMVNSYHYDFKTQKDETLTKYLDFKSGKVTVIKLAEPGDIGFIRMSDSCYVGQDYAAFLTFTRDRNDNAQNMVHLSRLNLRTLQIEPKVVSVKAAETHILGVLADGRIVFWYDFNPSENGVGITNKGPLHSIE